MENKVNAGNQEDNKSINSEQQSQMNKKSEEIRNTIIDVQMHKDIIDEFILGEEGDQNGEDPIAHIKSLIKKKSMLKVESVNLS